MAAEKKGDLQYIPSCLLLLVTDLCISKVGHFQLGPNGWSQVQSIDFPKYSLALH